MTSNIKRTALRGAALTLAASGLTTMACGAADEDDSQTAEVAAAVQDNTFGTFSNGTAAPGNMLATHATMLTNNQVLVVAGSSYNCCFQWGREMSRLYNLSTNTWSSPIASPAPYAVTNGIVPDAFCSGHAKDYLGRVIFQGGLEGYGTQGGNLPGQNGQGVVNTARYNPSTNNFTQLSSTVQHWYPTLMAGAADMFLIPGKDGDPTSDARIRRMRYGATSWSDGGVDHVVTTYPRTHLLPSGNVFISSWQGTGRVNHFYQPWAATITQAGSNGVPNASADGGAYDNWRGTAVLLPLTPVDGRYPSAKVAIINGVTPYVREVGDSLGNWTPMGSRPTELGVNTQRRLFGNATLLPTGQVLVTGGVHVANNDATAVKNAEVYDPATNQWLLTSAASKARNYHNVALLMADGRVWIAGASQNERGSFCGGTPSGCDTSANGTPESTEEAVEIFTPWYHGRSDRIVITNAPANIMNEGGRFQISIGSSQGTSVAKVALIRSGSVTHAFDTDQRMIWLDIVSKTASTVTVKAPYSATAAPPGDYMLFVLRDLGSAAGMKRYVPSLGRTIRIDNQVVRRAVSASSIQSVFDSQVALGYRLTQLDGYEVGGSTFFNLVFSRMDGVNWAARWGMTSAEFQTEANSRIAAGYRITSMDSWWFNGTLHYGAVFDQTAAPGGTWTAYWGWAEADHNTQFSTLTSQGFRPVSMTVIRSGSQRLFSVLWDKASVGTSVAFPALTEAQYHTEFANQLALGRRPGSINVFQDTSNVPKYTLIFNQENTGAFACGHPLTTTNLDDSIVNTLSQGLASKDIAGFDNGSGSHRFAACWTALR
jgi:hypothetical protein